MILTFFGLLGIAQSNAGNSTFESFSAAKNQARKLYSDHRTTFYCACQFDEHLQVDHASCGYVPLHPGKRAQRVEWEHVVPAQAFGRSFSEWREGHSSCVDRKGRAFKGRACARKASRQFRFMEGDLYNLVPAIGDVNGARSNYSMAEISGEARRFGACDLEVEARKIEPRLEIRGDIARIYFYMEASYPGRAPISDRRRLFDVWSRLDPVDVSECDRARRIKDVQGNFNRFVSAVCEKEGLLVRRP